MASPEPSHGPGPHVSKTVRSGPQTRSLSRRQSFHDAQDDTPSAAAAHSHPERLERARELAITCARIADDNRGRDILVLDMRPVTSLVDFFVIASAASRRQALAMAAEIETDMKRRGEARLGIEGDEEGRWILIDYGDFVVHVFSEDARSYYALEEIWGDAPRLDWGKPQPSAPRDAAQA
ncbi:MAG: hypothetical protein KatS3mg108_2731 [Isosphaeraceae bacterium]|jgi:ribosome-associated protein|nr:MAG: hypothetical protein KatS3mg108_2731 [Isosphaeraceae bacterium]